MAYGDFRKRLKGVPVLRIAFLLASDVWGRDGFVLPVGFVLFLCKGFYILRSFFANSLRCYRRYLGFISFPSLLLVIAILMAKHFYLVDRESYSLCDKKEYVFYTNKTKLQSWQSPPFEYSKMTSNQSYMITFNVKINNNTNYTNILGRPKSFLRFIRK